MERFPQELAHAFTGVFPRSDPYTSVWDQSEGSALEKSANEDHVCYDEELRGSRALFGAFVWSLLAV